MHGHLRTMVANVGAAQSITLDHIKQNKEIIRQMEEAKLIYIEGYFLNKRENIGRYIADFCKERRKLLAYNISGSYICKEVPETVAYLARKCDMIFGNREEYASLKEAMSFKCNTDEFPFELSKLYDHEPSTRYRKIVMRTDAFRPCLVVYNDGEYFTMNVPAVKHIKDTIGAGDSFVAGCFASYLKGKDIKNVILGGLWVAMKVIQEVGAHPPEYSSKLCSVFLPD